MKICSPHPPLIAQTKVLFSPHTPPHDRSFLSIYVFGTSFGLAFLFIDSLTNVNTLIIREYLALLLEVDNSQLDLPRTRTSLYLLVHCIIIKDPTKFPRWLIRHYTWWSLIRNWSKVNNRSKYKNENTFICAKRRFYIEKQIALLVKRHDDSKDHGILTRNFIDKSVKIAPTVIKPIPCETNIDVVCMFVSPGIQSWNLIFTTSKLENE